MVTLRCPRCNHKFACAPSPDGRAWCPRCGAKLLAPGSQWAKPEDLVGQSLGQYDLVELIRTGPTGSLYGAKHQLLPRTCVVKVLPKEVANDPSFAERFRREAHAIAAIKHPGVIQVFEVGEDKGHSFIVMEHVDGESLADRLRREGPLSPDLAHSLLEQAASVLAAAHALRIVHRNIKPANLLLATDGTLKVADFGLAKRSGEDADVTVRGARLGTPMYMAPEVAEGGAADARSDLYSLGATFYYLVAGRPPLDAPTMVALLRKVLQEEPPPLPPSVPSPLRDVVHGLLAKDPSKRFQTAQAVLDALQGREGPLAEAPTKPRELPVLPPVPPAAPSVPSAPPPVPPARAPVPPAPPAVPPAPDRPATHQPPQSAASRVQKHREDKIRRRKRTLLFALAAAILVLLGVIIFLLLRRG